jgi:hypothetical protein
MEYEALLKNDIASETLVLGSKIVPAPLQPPQFRWGVDMCPFGLLFSLQRKSGRSKPGL